MRLLFITATRVGDAVLSTGLLRHLLERHPGARVTVAAGLAAAPLFEAVPGLERLLAFDKRPFKAHWLGLLARPHSGAGIWWSTCAPRRSPTFCPRAGA